MALLSEEERARRRRFRFEHSRREYLTTHALARMALSHDRPIAPRAWQFTANAHGKPAITPDCGLRFNLSNTAAMAVCLVSDAPAQVGVDVESHARVARIAEVAQKVFSEAERSQLDALSASAKLDRCLSLWTLKEAYVKARGIGMTLPLRGISFLFDEGGAVRLFLDPELHDDAERWHFRTLNHAQHRIAVVAEETNIDDLEMWELRPPALRPVRITTDQNRC